MTRKEYDRLVKHITTYLPNCEGERDTLLAAMEEWWKQHLAGRAKP